MIWRLGVGVSRRLGHRPSTSSAEMRRRAFRLVITPSKLPYDDFEEQALYIAR